MAQKWHNFILQWNEIGKKGKEKLKILLPILINTGAGGRIRTLNPQIRSLMLYPVELRPRWENVWKKLMFPAEFGHDYLGRAKGFEPSTTGITIQRSTS